MFSTQSSIVNDTSVTWESLSQYWTAMKSSFLPSSAWQEALEMLNVSSASAMAPPFDTHNVRSVIENTKTELLVLQVCKQNKNKQWICQDMTGEIKCVFHPKLLESLSLFEGDVIILKDVTILPGPFVLITESNIVKVICN